MKLPSQVNTNPNQPPKSRPVKQESSAKVTYVPHEFLWALIGLFLTILTTFLEASITNAPWNWSSRGVTPHSLGVTYQVGAVLLTGCLGGKKAGVLAQIAYIVLGLTWLPVFAQGGGWSYLEQPSFGYILGFIPGAWLCGWLSFRDRPTVEGLAKSAFLGLLAIHVLGLVYLVGLSLLKPQEYPWADFMSSFFQYSLLPLPGQLVIICVVALIAYSLRLLLFY